MQILKDPQILKKYLVSWEILKLTKLKPFEYNLLDGCFVKINLNGFFFAFIIHPKNIYFQNREQSFR